MKTEKDKLTKGICKTCKKKKYVNKSNYCFDCFEEEVKKLKEDI